MRKKIITWIVFSIFAAFVVMAMTSCKGKEKKQSTKKQTVIVAKLKTPVTRLFFTGSLLPIDTIEVTSPVEGRVSKLKFSYGQEVKKNQLLVVLSSKTLAENFRKAVSDFLQKKDAYDNAIQSFEGNKALYKAGIISKENFLSERSQYENTVLSYFQSQYDLEKLLEKAKVEYKPIEQLQLADIKQISKLLRRKFNDIEVYSPASGVALFPTSESGGDSNDSQNGKTGKLEVGTKVKSGQTLLSIGDLSGLSTQFNVSEINVNRIKKDMPAVITGDAFPGITLKGFVSQVSSQANPQQGGGGDGQTSLSMFNVNVKIPKLTPEQKKIIHVGMTAKIAISIKEKPVVMLPITAIKTKKGINTVTLIDKSGQKKTVNVTLGSTTPEGQVAIISGVKSGDKVVVND